MSREEPRRPAGGRRRGWLASAAWLLVALSWVALTPALGDSTVASGEGAPPPVLIAVLEEGTSEPWDATAAPSSGARPRHFWARSGDGPFRRASSAQEAAAVAAKRGDALVEIRLPALASGAEVPGALVVAPVAMWEEVSSDLLSRWTLRAPGSVGVALDEGERYRARWVARGYATDWVEIDARRREWKLEAGAAVGREVRLVTPSGEGVERGVALLGDARRGPLPLEIFAADGRGVTKLAGTPSAFVGQWTFGGRGVLAQSWACRAARLPERVVLEPGCELAGRLLDSRGKPIVEARVVGEAFLGGEATTRVERRTGPGADGRFRLQALPLAPVALTVDAPGRAQRRELVEVGECRDGLLRLEDWRLDPGVDMNLRVVDDVGAPVASALVLADPGVEATTDREGRAKLTSLRAGDSISVDVEKEGYAEVSVTLAVAAGATLEVVLRRMVRVVGRVVQQDGIPVEAGTVRIQRGRAFEESSIRRGRLDLHLPPGEPAELRIVSSAARELRSAVGPGAPGEVVDLGTLVLPAGATVAGRVLSAATGEPVAGASVALPRLGEGGEILAWLRRDLLLATTDARGEFALRGVEPGSAGLRIEAEGFVPSEAVVEVGPDDETVESGDLELHRGGVVHVTYDDDGTGVARFDPGGRWDETKMVVARLDAGEAWIEPVPPGPGIVTVLLAGAIACEVEVVAPAAGEVDAECEKDRLRVSGTVLSGGRTAGNGRLIWRREGTVEQSSVIVRTVTRSGLTRQRAFGAGPPSVDVAVEGGAFESDDLRPGRWSVAWRPGEGAGSPERSVALPEAEEVHLELSFSGYSISGRVTFGDGEAAPWTRVSTSDRRAHAVAAADGTFELSDLEPGRVGVQARFEALRSPVVEVLIDGENPLQRVDLVLGPDEEEPLTLEVSGPAGPVAGALIWVELGTEPPRLLFTGAGGRATVELPSPRPRQVRAAAFAAGRWGWTPWSELPAEGGATLGVVAAGNATLEVWTNRLAGRLGLTALDGWRLDALWGHAGIAGAVGPESPLRLTGLPGGEYLVTLGEFVERVSLPADGQAAVELDE